MADHYDVEVKVDKGEIYCKREHCQKNDTLTWHCTDPFILDFGWKSPFKKQQKATGVWQAPNNRFETPQLTVHATAVNQGYPMQFKYTVAVFDAGNQVLLIEDPEIIIDP